MLNAFGKLFGTSIITRSRKCRRQGVGEVVVVAVGDAAGVVGEVASASALDLGVISSRGGWGNELLHLGDEGIFIRVGGVRIFPEEGFLSLLIYVL